MAVTHNSFNVAGTNAGLAYDSEPFFSQGPPFFRSAFLMSPLLPYCGVHRDPLYVAAIRALGDL